MKKKFVFVIIVVLLAALVAGCGIPLESGSEDRTVVKSETDENKNDKSKLIKSDGIRSNYIATIPTGNVDYNIDIVDYGGVKSFNFLDKDVVRTVDSTGDKLYNLNGSEFLDNNKILKHFNNKYTNVYYYQKHSNYLSVGLSNNEENLCCVYNYKEDKIEKFNSIPFFSDDYIIIQSGLTSSDIKSSVLDMNYNIIVPVTKGYSFKEIHNNRIVAGDTKTNKYGIIDFDGNILVDFKYDSISSSDDYDMGHLFLNSKMFHDDSNNKSDYLVGEKYIDNTDILTVSEYYLIDKDNNETYYQTDFSLNSSVLPVPCSQYKGKYYFAKSALETRDIKEVKESESSYAVIDNENNTIINNAFCISGFYNGYCLAKFENGEEIETRLYDLNGNVIFSVSGKNTISLPDRYGLFLVGENDSSKYSVYDLNLKKVYEFNKGEFVDILGNGLFGVKSDFNSREYEQFIRITRR